MSKVRNSTETMMTSDDQAPGIVGGGEFSRDQEIGKRKNTANFNQICEFMDDCRSGLFIALGKLLYSFKPAH